jgi:CBS-domain-containing membrane protein
LSRTVHPPAGSNPVIVFLGHSAWSFLLFPVVSGALILVLIGWLYNNAVRETRIPITGSRQILLRCPNGPARERMWIS